MANNTSYQITLEDARQLVVLLEAGEQQQADELFDSLSQDNNQGLFAEVGKLTRQLHDSLNSFQLDGRLADLTQEDIPDAQSRLNYVIETTENAANTTMDAVEKSMPIAESLSSELKKILPEWQKLMSRQIELGEFKTLCHDVDAFMHHADQEMDKLTGLLTEVLMAQGYQDITGQVIRRVIDLVKEVEDSLVHLLAMFSGVEVADKEKKNSKASAKKPDNVEAEGPIINPEERDDVVTGQDDVDDLLSSLGF
ncbi:protein phosphatase CheZ [Bowmanella sp. JS7-9]|jgi:chemotaxis protein CheZ|uniref:Protein phosphatase CheZ n=1 Tax=Pseudobowmanella zhangzhouensis TaxID=1537679 RepID=A0ABW1XL40_9ALTE|nr:protein phosphatase CheZ [Bowmanella sp. JS7-9]TBX25841.1 protein phosphatase [Bowmanella sp. JS7-9]